MTPPLRAWLGGRARARAGGPVSRLLRLAAAVVLLCALWPAVASARSERRPHAGRHHIHTSLRTVSPRDPRLHLGSGEGARRGSPAVRRLQRGLRRAGYATGPIDGRYGPLTAAAVERFQANHGLIVNGVVDPATWHALRATPVLALGAGVASPHGSPAVARLQRLLRRAGFSPGPIDGRLGPRTEHAIIGFQRARHLPVDGVAGPITLRALQSAIGRPTRGLGGTRGSLRARRPRTSPTTSRSRQAQRTPRTQPVRLNAPVPQRPPVVWIILGLVLLALAAAAGGHLYARRRTPGRAAPRRRRLTLGSRGRVR